jgi:DNA-binding GntR family transcriptional regulator
MSTLLRPRHDQSLAEAVAEHLRDGIQDGTYAPGARLVERSLAAALGVSHIPVREALARLEEEGLVVRLPRRGARVAELSDAGLAEISSLRVVLEGFVVRRVQERWTTPQRRELERMVDRMVAAARRGDVAAVSDVDRRFHQRLWRIADHSILLEVSAGLRGRVNRFLQAATEALPPGELVRHAESHRDLLQVIASGDPDAAAAAMRSHVEAAAARIEAGG